MIDYAIVPATMAHAYELAQTMRQADRDEVIAQSGLPYGIGLGMSLGNAEAAWTGLIEGEVACIFGVSAADEFDGKVGIPWMLGSELVVKHQRLFLRHCRGCVDEMQALFPVLENHVDQRNTIAIRWLKWLGFDILPVEPHGPFKLPFHPFRRVRE